MKKLAEICGYDNPFRCTAHGKQKCGTTALVNTEGIGPKTTISLTRHASYSTVARYEKPTQKAQDLCIDTLNSAGGPATALKLLQETNQEHEVEDDRKMEVEPSAGESIELLA